MTGAFDCRSDFALVLQRVASDAAGQQFALFVDELEQKLTVFVINMFDTKFCETAIFLALRANVWVAEEFDIISARTRSAIGACGRFYNFLFDGTLNLISETMINALKSSIYD